MNRHSQKGSALLIVLGFLSFMVVSAVAFAIWMRNERQPSSALRRSVASRFLVKAALAQAMSRVDDAIRSHPYPGAWNTNSPGTVYRDQNNCPYDWWTSRVFMPPDPEGVGTISGDPDSRYAPVTKTVSVLNLEALGYLPPALINDVRLLARSSWASQWEYFNFDAGRYAFCAVDVSDMLDINKIAADRSRTSAAAAHRAPSGDKPPSSRYSLAYLFRNGEYDFSSPNNPGNFDKLIHSDLEWKEAPLVSMMDYNLALEDKQAGRIFSPFYYFISKKNNRSSEFYGGGEGSQGVRGAEPQLFVTDSWFPEAKQTSSGASTDLTRYQPFRTGMDNGGKAVLRDAITALENNFWDRMQMDTSLFCVLDNYTLFDYLDKDNVPLSLAMPCAERVPMIAALGPVERELRVSFESTPPREEKNGNTKQKISETKIKVEFPTLSTTIIYPFKNDGRAPGSYTAEAFLRLVFVASRPEEGVVQLRNNDFARTLHPLQDDWPDLSDRKFELEAGHAGDLTREAQQGCLLLSQKDSRSYVPESIPASTENTAGNNKKIAKNLPLGRGGTSDGVLFQKIESVELNEKGDEMPETKKTVYKIPLRAFRPDGSLVVDSPETEISEADFAKICEYQIRPYFAAWVRLKDGNDTVDMVPASFLDDSLSGKDNSGARSPELLGCGADFNEPVMRFLSKATFTYADAATKQQPEDISWVDTSCYAVDPRFNWAPENWLFNVPDFQWADSPDNWFNLVFKDDTGEGSVVQALAKAEFAGVEGMADRARDPFLFVSNSGYLQSVGELAFLPRVSAILNNGGVSSSSVLGAGGGGDRLYNGVQRTLETVSSLPCALAAWKSYQTYRTNPSDSAFEFGANLYRRRLRNGSQGFYVNPFTHSHEVMLAALANTPFDYWVAGTNDTVKTVPSDFKADANHPVFGHGSSVMTGEDVDKIATFLRHRFEDLACMVKMPANPNSDDVYAFQQIWEDMFDAMDWGARRSNKSGRSYTVRELYRDLETYVNAGSGDFKNGYETMYLQKNGHRALNGFVLQNKSNVSISFNENDLPHKDELGYEADPLRGQCKQGETQCYAKLHDIDRMFLHSYWRDCFANRQQLFLIFVRAESTALGGTGEGTPAQQGGRAVALVWRDPCPPTGAYARENEDTSYKPERQPHKMRILFYRQLD